MAKTALNLKAWEGAGGAAASAAKKRAPGGVARAGSALLGAGGSRVNPGVGQAGSALLGVRGGGGRGSGPGAATTVGGVTPAAAGGSSAAVPAGPATALPFLTPAQQKALDDWNTSYGERLNALKAADATAQAKWTSQTGAENLKFATSEDMTNQAMGARGIFQSSIRMNALNDLAVSHAVAINTINTNRDTAINNDQITRQDLAGQDAANQGYYQGLAVENAQNTPPVTGDNAGVSATSQATSAPPAPAQHPAASAAPGLGSAAGTALMQPSAAAALEHQPHNTGLAATGTALAMHGAALTRVQQPKAKAPGLGMNIGTAGLRGVGVPK